MKTFERAHPPTQAGGNESLLAAAVRKGAALLPEDVRRNRKPANRFQAGRNIRVKTYLPKELNGIDDLAEYVPDCGSKDRQNDDDNDGNQNKD
jgi:hypothetical protein